MTEFQLGFLCLFGLALLFLAIYTSKYRVDDLSGNTFYTLTTEGEETTVPYTYTTYAAEEGVTQQTALEFSRVFGRAAVLAAEQMYKSGQIPKEARKETALSILKTFIRAQGYTDPDTDKDIVEALPYIIEFCVYEQSQPLF